MLTADDIGNYINALRQTKGREREAARLARVDMAEIRELRATSDEFRSMEKDVMSDIVEELNRAIWTRAVDGVDKAVWYKGEKIATEKQYSDTLLLALAKKHDPGFTDRKVVTGTNGEPIRIQIQDFSNLSDTRPTAEEVIAAAGEKAGLF